MKRLILSTGLFVLVISLFGCAPGGFLRSEPTPTPTQEPASINGSLNFASEPINDATVSLTRYRDEDCLEKTQGDANDYGLSEEEFEQILDDCIDHDYAEVMSDAQGKYEFSRIEPGWYKITLNWVLDGKPDVMQPFMIEFGFLISYYETNTSPKMYAASAIQLDEFYFTGEEGIVIDFTAGAE